MSYGLQNILFHLLSNQYFYSSFPGRHASLVTKTILYKAENTNIHTWDTGIDALLTFFCGISPCGGGEWSCTLCSDEGLALPLPFTSLSWSHALSSSSCCCCCCSFRTFSREAACCKQTIRHINENGT